MNWIKRHPFISITVACLLFTLWLIKWLTLARLDLMLTIFLACCLAIVAFECGFQALRDFGGFND